MGTALLSRTDTTAPESAVRVLVRAEMEAVEPARGIVRRALGREGWAEDEIACVVLAFSEALTNAINHGSTPGAAVAVEIVARGARVRIRVRDRGRRGHACPPGAPAAAPPPSSEHGRGLMIMAALSDRLEIVRTRRGTEVRLAFRRPGTLRPPAAA